MTSEKDKKDHLLTLRIPKQWVVTLEKMRDQFGEKGEKRSVAHIVRDSLRDTVEDHQTHDHVGEKRRLNRLYELQKNKAQSLSSIREMILNDDLIPRAEWEFLCLQSAAAYRLRTRDIYNSALLMDVVKAFERQILNIRWRLLENHLYQPLAGISSCVILRCACEMRLFP